MNTANTATIALVNTIIVHGDICVSAVIYK